MFKAIVKRDNDGNILSKEDYIEYVGRLYYEHAYMVPHACCEPLKIPEPLTGEYKFKETLKFIAEDPVRRHKDINKLIEFDFKANKIMKASANREVEKAREAGFLTLVRTGQADSQWFEKIMHASTLEEIEESLEKSELESQEKIEENEKLIFNVIGGV